MKIIQYILVGHFVLWGIGFAIGGLYTDDLISVRLQAMQLSVLCFIAVKLWLPKNKKGA